MQISTRFFVLASCVLSVLAQSAHLQALNQTITTLTTQAQIWTTDIDKLTVTNAAVAGPKIPQDCAEVINTLSLSQSQQNGDPPFSPADSQALVVSLKTDKTATIGALVKLVEKHDLLAHFGFTGPIGVCLTNLEGSYDAFLYSTIGSLTGPAVADARTVHAELDVSFQKTIKAYSSAPPPSS